MRLPGGSGPVARVVATFVVVMAWATPLRAAGAPGPITLDSLVSERIPRGLIAATDAPSLTRLRREVDNAAEQIRRFLGKYPPAIGVAAVGNLPDPSRADAASLRLAGIDYVVTDWPEPAKRAGDAAASPPSMLAERIARWDLQAYERANSHATPPAGHTRVIPDWFESAIAGLSTTPTEQKRRADWMSAHASDHIALAKFFDLARPAAAESKPAGGKSGPGAKRAAGAPAPRAAPRRAASPAAGSGGATAAVSAELFDAQALSFARFLNEREGERFLGMWLDVVLSGEPQSAAFNIAKTLFADPAALEKEWLAWMKDGTAPK